MALKPSNSSPSVSHWELREVENRFGTLELNASYKWIRYDYYNVMSAATLFK
jgi:hypothetical protein